MNYTRAYSLQEGVSVLVQLAAMQKKMPDQDENVMGDDEILQRAASALAEQERNQKLCLMFQASLGSKHSQRLRLRRKDLPSVLWLSQ